MRLPAGEWWPPEDIKSCYLKYIRFWRWKVYQLCERYPYVVLAGNGQQTESLHNHRGEGHENLDSELE